MSVPPVNSDPLAFLDVDGVIAPCPGRGRLDPVLVGRLNRLVRTFPRIEIVLNSSWNINGVPEVRGRLAAAGFERPEVLVDRTAGCHGGGGLVREWLRAVPGRLGRPYVILDDGTPYDACLARLAWCPPPTFLSDAVVDEAITILRRVPSPEGERQAALRVLDQLDAFPRPWLDDVRRLACAEEHAALRRRLRDLSDQDFMDACCHLGEYR